MGGGERPQGAGGLARGLEPQFQLFLPSLWVLVPCPVPSLLLSLLVLPLSLPRPPVSPGKLSTHTAPVTLLLPPPSLSGVLSDQRPSQLFHFWVLGARDPFLEFLTTGGTDPTLASTGLQKWGLFPVLSGSRPVVSRPGLTPP